MNIFLYDAKPKLLFNRSTVTTNGTIAVNDYVDPAWKGYLEFSAILASNDSNHVIGRRINYSIRFFGAAINQTTNSIELSVINVYIDVGTNRVRLINKLLGSDAIGIYEIYGLVK